MKRWGIAAAALAAVLPFLALIAQEAGNPANLALNPGFEEPEAPEEAALPLRWAYFTSARPSCTVTKEASRSGLQAVRLSAQKTANAIQGLLMDLPVEPGRKYTFSLFVRSSKAGPLSGPAVGMLVVEWRRADGKEISRAASSPWDAKLSRLRWEMFSISQAVPPAGAVTGRFGIHLLDGVGGGGAFLADDAVIFSE